MASACRKIQESLWRCWLSRRRFGFGLVSAQPLSPVLLQGQSSPRGTAPNGRQLIPDPRFE